MKELDRVVAAVETLKLVAKHLRTPLDTVELEAALEALRSVLAAGPAKSAKPQTEK
jgi:hypothetical protein